MSLISADKLGIIVAVSIVIVFVGIGVGMSNVSPTVSDRPGMEQQAKSVDPKFKDEKKESTEKELLDKERDLKEKQREAEIKKAEEKNLEERKAEIKKAEEKNLEERKAEIKKAEEKNLEERKAEIKKAEEKNLEERKAEIKKAEEKNLEEKDTTKNQNDDASTSTGRDLPCGGIPIHFIPDYSITSYAQIHFTWYDVYGYGCPVTYNIERSNDNGQTWIVVASQISQIEFTDSSVVPGQSYTYRFQSVTQLGSSGYWTAVISTAPPPVPDSHADWQVLGNSPPLTMRSDDVLFTWGHSSTSTTSTDLFEVWRSSDNVTWYSIGTAMPFNGAWNDHEFIDPNANVGQTYYYKVRAHNVFGYSGFSDVVDITTTLGPDTPTNLSAIQVSSEVGIPIWADLGDVHLTWDASDGHGFPIDSYVVYYTEDLNDWYDGHESWVDNGNPVVPEIFSGGHDTETIIYFKVKAYTQVGESYFSDVLSITTLPAPDAPTNFAIIHVSEGLQIIWDEPNGNGFPIIHYEIFRSPQGADWHQMSHISTNTAFIDTSVNAGQSYRYMVKAYSVGGGGDYSDWTPSVAFDNSVPVAPTNLTVTQSMGTPLLTWNIYNYPSGVAFTLPPGYPYIDSFDVLRSSDNVTWSSVSSVAASSYSDVTFIDPNANVGQTYYYKVRAHNVFGFSDPSDIVSFTVVSTPDAPTNLSVTNSYPTTNPYLTWNTPFENGGTIDFYNVYRSEDNISWSNVQTTTGFETTYEDPNVNAGQTYYYKVRAHNVSGLGNFSDIVSFTVVSTPDAPANLVTALDTSSSGGSTVILIWDEPNDNCFGTPGCYINYYDISRSEDGMSWPFVQVIYSASGCVTAFSCPTEFVPNPNFQSMFVDQSVNIGQTYYYNIRAHNTVGYSVYSDTVSISVEPVPDAPTITSITYAPNGLHLRWDEPNDYGTPISSYLIHRSVDNISWNLLTQLSGASNTEFTDTTVNAGQTYYYKVRSDNIFGLSAYSDTVSLPAIFSPDAPIILSVHDNSISQTLLSLSWYHPNPINVDEYRIERSNDNVTWQLVAVESQIDDRFIDNNVLSGQVYYYRIQAYNMAGFSDYSNIFSGIPN